MIPSKIIKHLFLFLLCFSFSITTKASYIFISMDENQSNHLKAYGIAYYALEKNITVDWLLNYQGGSFMVKHYKEIENECNIRGFHLILLQIFKQPKS